MTHSNASALTRAKLVTGWTSLLIAAMALTTVNVIAAKDEPVENLEANAQHHRISSLVTRFIEKSHYTRTPVNDELSAQVLDTYIDALDSNKLFFLDSDLERFERYRDRIDNMVVGASLEPVFDIFRTYQTRSEERWNYALAQIEQEPDFGVDETFRFDREDAQWATNKAELDEIWRKRVKNDALNLLLTDTEWNDVQEKLRKRYTRFVKRGEQINSDDVFEIFMNAFARTLDPHSSYLSPRNSEEYRIQMSLSYSGIGASLQTEDDFVKVMNVIAGGPAAIDGTLKAADRIVGVGEGPDGEIVDVIGWRLDDVVQLIRGPKDTVVRLQILPANAMPGDPNNELKLIRGQVKLEEQAAKSSIIDIERDGRKLKVGVIDIPSFYRDYQAQQAGEKDFKSTTRDVQRILGELNAEGVDGVVVDLRGNGGGHLTEATMLSGLFIDQGPVVQLRYARSRVEVLRDPLPSVAYNGPLAVLVDRFSASASEIFAGAIQDYERGVVIGQQTFGKGSVQNLYNLDQFVPRSEGDGLGQLTLTIGKYYRVTGDSTQNRGVLPDIELPSLIDTAEFGESTRPRALPWDQIQTTRFDAGTPLDRQIQTLTANLNTRLAEDPDHAYLLGDLEAVRANRERDTISLNLATRKAERAAFRDARLARENIRRTAIGLPELEDLEALESEEPPDIVLNEAADVVADMAEIATVTVPAQSASLKR
ncbi:MAG: carboxy terminal-processing peptidase [Pseudomonadota bacterium]